MIEAAVNGYSVIANFLSPKIDKAYLITPKEIKKIIKRESSCVDKINNVLFPIFVIDGNMPLYNYHYIEIVSRNLYFLRIESIDSKLTSTV